MPCWAELPRAKSDRGKAQAKPAAGQRSGHWARPRRPGARLKGNSPIAPTDSQSSRTSGALSRGVSRISRGADPELIQKRANRIRFRLPGRRLRRAEALAGRRPHGASATEPAQ